MKVEELSGALLDYWVLRADGWVDDRLHDMQLTRNGEYCIAGAAPNHAVGGHCWRSPSTDWAVGGPIVEADQIGIGPATRIGGGWAAIVASANHDAVHTVYADTPLVAAMRAKVMSHYGEEVPDV